MPSARLYLEVLDLASQPPLFAIHVLVYYDGRGPYLLSGETTGMLAMKPVRCEEDGRLDLLWWLNDPPGESVELSTRSVDAMDSDPYVRGLFQWMKRHDDDRPVDADFLTLAKLLHQATGVPTVTNGYARDPPLRPQVLEQVTPDEAAQWESTGWLPGH